jgi:Protein of unknown function (DUF2510)
VRRYWRDAVKSAAIFFLIVGVVCIYLGVRSGGRIGLMAIGAVAVIGSVAGFWYLRVSPIRAAIPFVGDPPGWYPDPYGKSDEMYWDGFRWDPGAHR